ncbi:MAG: transferrin-binding protein-like solute binding protein [Sphingomonadales bacterium]|nr:transferrin-binding protein-like solute binding protein [Sphingomonadales bacterium]
MRNVVQADLNNTYVLVTLPDGTRVRELATSSTRSRYNFSRSAFIFGQQTDGSSVPASGTGSFSGEMIASSVINDRRDNIDLADGEDGSTYFQWIEGRANLDFNFGQNTFAVGLNGRVFAPYFDNGTSGNHTIRDNATFNATGAGRIDLVATGGFLGQFQQAWFVNPDNTRYNLLIGGSSVDGAFYGPQAQEVGGNFRIVGGTPDERIDILGVFTGSKK